LTWGAAVALGLHGLAALGLAAVSPRRGQSERAIAVEIHEAPPPPAPSPPPPEPTPPPPERPLLARRPRIALPPSAPMPNRESKPGPPSEEPVESVFGVTEDSVVTGDSPVAVPVGNTLMTKDRALAKAPPPPLPPAPPPPPAFAPVDDEEVAEWPKELAKPKADYPEAAARMGVGGRVLLKIGVDSKGNVKTARILQKAGYGMDEEALKRIWQHKFAPARRANGQPVDVVLTYGYRFDPPTQ
jgi:protein TonB